MPVNSRRPLGALIVQASLTSAALAGGATITVTTTEDVVDFGGAQQVANLPGPGGRVSIRETLRLTGGNREQAAKLLGIGERTLYRKLKEYGLR